LDAPEARTGGMNMADNLVAFAATAAPGAVPVDPASLQLSIIADQPRIVSPLDAYSISASDALVLAADYRRAAFISRGIGLPDNGDAFDHAAVVWEGVALSGEPSAGEH